MSLVMSRGEGGRETDHVSVLAGVAAKANTRAAQRFTLVPIGLPLSGGPGSKLVHPLSCDDGRVSGRH